MGLKAVKRDIDRRSGAEKTQNLCFGKDLSRAANFAEFIGKEAGQIPCTSIC